VILFQIYYIVRVVFHLCSIIRASWYSHLPDVEATFSICNQCWHQHLWDCFESIWVSPLHTLVYFMFSFICNSSTLFTFLIDFSSTPIHISFLLFSSLSFHFYTCFQFVFLISIDGDGFTFFFFFVLNSQHFLQLFLFVFFYCILQHFKLDLELNTNSSLILTFV